MRELYPEAVFVGEQIGTVSIFGWGVRRCYVLFLEQARLASERGRSSADCCGFRR
jgi:hypothetical protein